MGDAGTVTVARGDRPGPKPPDPPEDKERIALRRTAAAVLRLAWQASPAAAVTLTVFSALNALMAPAVLWLGRHLINLIAEGVEPGSVIPTVIALGAAASFQRVAAVVLQYRQQTASWHVLRVAQERFLQRAARVDVGHLDDPSFHDMMQRASRESNYRPFNLAYTLVTFTGLIVTLVGLVGLLALLHPLLVLLTGGSALVSAIAQRRVSQKLYRTQFQDTAEEREQAYVAGLLTQHQTLKEVRAFGLEDHFLRRHRNLALYIIANRADVFRTGQRASVGSGLIGAVMLGAAYWFVAARGVSGDLTPGDLFLVMSAFAQTTTLVASISSSVVMVQEHATFLRDYFEFLDTPPLITVRPDPIPLPRPLPGIAIEHVSFAYPNGDTALRDVSFELRPGEMLALVGENGAGKTTLVKLLLRFYDPQSGRLLVGGVDVKDADPDDLRSRFGVLFQDFVHYALSVRENVSLGRAGVSGSDESVWAALRAARAGELVERLPNGLDSKVGRLFEGGHDLSGGEWQRLALSRLMYRDAEVWVLDEPTSSLDPEAESAIFAELRANLAGRMGVVISHRFSTVRIADRIAVLEHGRITETGTHDELVALGGRYARLFELQASGYR